MYETGLVMRLLSSHYLTAASCCERAEHNHHYTVEAIIKAPQLDSHGYLIDITVLRAVLGSVLDRYQSRCMNDLPEFTDRAPTMENLAGEIWKRVRSRLEGGWGGTLTIRIWEAEDAWASFVGDI